MPSRNETAQDVEIYEGLALPAHISPDVLSAEQPKDHPELTELGENILKTLAQLPFLRVPGAPLKEERDRTAAGMEAKDARTKCHADEMLQIAMTSLGLVEEGELTKSVRDEALDKLKNAGYIDQRGGTTTKIFQLSGYGLSEVVRLRLVDRQTVDDALTPQLARKNAQLGNIGKKPYTVAFDAWQKLTANGQVALSIAANRFNIDGQIDDLDLRPDIVAEYIRDKSREYRADAADEEAKKILTQAYRIGGYIVRTNYDRDRKQKLDKKRVYVKPDILSLIYPNLADAALSVDVFRWAAKLRS